MSTSSKHRDFVGEPMADKKVTSVPGIGTAYGTNLTNAGYDKADQLFGQYLVQNKNEDRFVGWIKETANVNSNHANNAYNGLNEWATQNF